MISIFCRGNNFLLSYKFLSIDELYKIDHVCNTILNES